MSPAARRLLVLFGIALAARAAAALALGSTFRFSDEAVYFDTAGALLHGEGYAAGYEGAPGQPILLAGLKLLLPDRVEILRMGHALLSALGCVPVYLIAERLDGRRTATLAALVYALDPLLVLMGGLLYPEAAAAVVLPAAVLLALFASRRDSVPLSVACGLLLGGAALLRPVALAVVPVVACWMALTVPAPTWRRAAHGAAVVLACGLALLPWTLRNYRVHGGLTPIAGTATDLARAAADDVDQHGVTRALVGRALDDPAGFGRRLAVEFGHFWEFAPSRLMTDDPGSRQALHERDSRLPIQPLFGRSLRNWLSAVSFGIELLLAIVGLTLLWQRRRREAALLLGVVLAFALGYSLFFGKLRYRVPVLPFVFVCTGAGAAAFLERVSAPRRRQA